MSRQRRVLGVLACAAVLSGCGTSDPAVDTPARNGEGFEAAVDTPARNGEGSQAANGHEPEPPVVIVGGDVMLACGSGLPFAASAMEAGVEDLADEAEVVSALEHLAAEAGIDAPRALQRGSVANAEWIVLGGGPDERFEELIVGVGGWDADGPGEGGQYVRLDRVDGGWRAGGWGDCNLAPVLVRGVSWVEMTATSEGADPEATSVTVEVQEQECTSARDPAPFLNQPVVIEDEEIVTVYWTSESPKGDQTCPGNPSVERVVELDEPLGERALLDGSTWPPRRVSTA